MEPSADPSKSWKGRLCIAGRMCRAKNKACKSKSSSSAPISVCSYSREKSRDREAGLFCSVIVQIESRPPKIRTGIAPLCKAMREVNNDEDEILVLTILPAKEESATGTSSDVGNSECGPDHHHLQCNQSWGQDSYINFLRQEITRKMEVKIAACFRLKDIIIEEVNNAKATWIFMDRYFTRDLSFRLSGTECNVSLIGDDDESMVPDHFLLCDGLECSMVMEERLNPKSPKPMNGSTQQGTVYKLFFGCT
ncbi:hypothetical protein Patl1_00962 [Pistacia atlantica]|uniref:Uncharacterized protein n=1 Tax=Pistacia atlantica TaxID=434234 RepID=A0ACC1CDS5_9ROSI|nr:hypothetical protein Patl1_00962 [Pistacia atlantica]